MAGQLSGGVPLAGRRLRLQVITEVCPSCRDVLPTHHYCRRSRRPPCPAWQHACRAKLQRQWRV